MAGAFREGRGALRALPEACGHDFEIREYVSGAEFYADMGYMWECGIMFLDIISQKREVLLRR